MSRGWSKVSVCHTQVSLSCAVLCQIMSLQYLSRSSLHRMAGLPCRICFFRIVWYQMLILDYFGFSHIADYVCDLCPLSDPGVEHNYFHFCLCAATLLCVCLVRVHAGSCTIRQADGKVAFKEIPVFGYVVQPAMIRRCISLCWFFYLGLWCCPSLQYFMFTYWRNMRTSRQCAWWFVG